MNEYPEKSNLLLLQTKQKHNKFNFNKQKLFQSKNKK